MAQRINKDNFEEKSEKSAAGSGRFLFGQLYSVQAVITGAWGYRGRTRRHTFCI